MTPMTRRTLIIATVAAAGAAAVPGLAEHRLRRRLRAIVAGHFGPEIAAHPETETFLSEVIARRFPKIRHQLLPAGTAERQVIEDFVRSTTAVRAHESGTGFEYVGYASPWDQPCANTLSAGWT